MAQQGQRQHIRPGMIEPLIKKLFPRCPRDAMGQQLANPMACLLQPLQPLHRIYLATLRQWRLVLQVGEVLFDVVLQ